MIRLSNKAIVFDCDGVLVDTHNVWDRAYAALFGRYGAALDPADRRRLAALKPGPLRKAIAELLGSSQRPELLAAEVMALVATNLGHPIAPVPGAVEIVTALAGSRPLAVASNTPSRIVRSHLERIGLLSRFDAILGIDDCMASKPAPDIYQLACARLDVAPEHAAAIEDSQEGIDSAKAAGLYTIGVPSAPGDILHADATYLSLMDPALWRALAIPVPAAPARDNPA